MSRVREVLGLPPVEPAIALRFGPPTYTEEQVLAYAAAVSTGGAIPTPAGTGGDDSHAAAGDDGPGIDQNPSKSTNTEHRV